MDLTGKNVVITGGGRGMGRKFAVDMKNAGAKPYVVDVVQDNLDALKAETGIEGDILDVSKESDVEAFFNKYVDAHGAPDVLINNAGITADALFIRQKGEEITKFPMSNWEKVIGVNLTGVFLCAREAAYHMVKKGVKGVIINISSISRSGNLGQTNYTATKSGVDGMTVTWAKELSRYGIRVAAIAPGYINTEMVAKIRQDVLDKIIAQIPVGRLGEMDEISKTARFIVENDFVTGRIFEVDGGMRI
ncbi:3-ketoacyl-(acyl-carrier-protein) reductase [Candidatus Magnetobacterium bavaricum]|uniref:3-ketoacyl-(Acyl-carrier-protein) reductase n=1 Tax=Candidatus Magnetobacterium bavaricum TaxID=29290 RepID=A0A0F3GT69_9BACT|nr:3-ketoacyl-(acyl-carrier-protein) reductase [Candidatus Magnetobacterium bavaricum]